MYTTVHIAVPERRALAVPRAAVAHYGETEVVFVEHATPDAGRAFERMPVKLNERVEGDWLPVVGLEKGMIVVSSGLKAVEEAM